MQKLLHFPKTSSLIPNCFFSRLSSISFPLPQYSIFFSCLRSYKSISSIRCFSDIPMASSATVLPPPPIDEGLGRRFWIKYTNVWTQAMHTPFVVSLAAGNLKLDSFRHYIAQDVYFLRTFAKVYEMAEECADDDDAKVGIFKLRQSVLEELKMHDSIVKVSVQKDASERVHDSLCCLLMISHCNDRSRWIMQEWGVDLSKDSMPNAATVKYTDFLLATAAGKVGGVKAPGKLATPFEKTKLAAYTLGAMTPCMSLYAFLGKELQAFLDLSEDTHPFRKWIESYSSNAFQASALQTEDLLEKLSVSLTGEELGIIEKLYLQAMKLEIEFFLAQPLNQKTAVPLAREHNPAEHCLMLFSDFDLTCSVVDSSAILAEIAIITAQKSVQNQPNQSENQLVPMSSVDLRSTWADLSKQYTEEYEQCIEEILRCNEEEKFNYEVLRKALGDFSDFEKKANLRVIEAGVLKGLNVEDIKRTGERLILQDGCTSFFQTAISNDNLNTKVHVLSYCWCSDLIKSAFSSGGLEAVRIHANEFVYENSLSTGEIVKNVESPIDKVQAFTDILQNCDKDKEYLTVYIGDSVGDLLCLLEANIGIVVGSSSSLRRVGTHFGVSFVPLFPGVIKKQKQCVEESLSKWEGLSGVLYTVSSWAEICAFVLGS